MDDFNDYYNRFVSSTYGFNVLTYLVFLAAFFVIILFGVLTLLLKFTTVTRSQQSNRYGYQATD